MTSASSDLVGARTSQSTGATKKTAKVGEDREPKATCREPHQSSALNSPVRVTISTAATSPITSRSTEMAAAALKSA